MPDEKDVEGFRTFMERYKQGLKLKNPQLMLWAGRCHEV